jgi:MSHA biogenesis protein MshN
MSLINDMLRDLEKRRQKETPANAHVRVARAVNGCVFHKRWIGWVGGLVLLLGVALWMGAPLWSGEKAPETAGKGGLGGPPEAAGADQELAQKAERVAVTPAAEGRQQSSVAELASPATADNTVVSAAKGSLLDLTVEETDGSARIRLAFAELPEYHLLQSGAGDAPLIVSFNGTHITEALEIPEMVGPLLARISLRPQQEQLQLLVDLTEQAELRGLESVKQARQEHELIIEVVAVKTPKRHEEVPQQAVQAQTKPVASEVVAAPPLRPQSVPAPVAVPEPPRVSKSSNRLAPEKQAYQEGLAAMQQSHWVAAEEHFRRALRYQPEMLTARLQLITSLQQQDKLEAAVNHMRQGLAQRPDNPALRKLYARYLLDLKNYGPAIELLQSSPLPAVSGDTEYHALLAAVLQQAGRFTAAGRVYRQLVQVRADNAIWWFGLALALDQVQDHEKASQAYQQALALPQLQDHLRVYSRERLRVL